MLQGAVYAFDFTPEHHDDHEIVYDRVLDLGYTKEIGLLDSAQAGYYVIVDLIKYEKQTGYKVTDGNILTGATLQTINLEILNAIEGE